jgi:hypothetical protein
VRFDLFRRSKFLVSLYEIKGIHYPSQILRLACLSRQVKDLQHFDRENNFGAEKRDAHLPLSPEHGQPSASARSTLTEDPNAPRVKPGLRRTVTRSSAALREDKSVSRRRHPAGPNARSLRPHALAAGGRGLTIAEGLGVCPITLTGPPPARPGQGVSRSPSCSIPGGDRMALSMRGRPRQSQIDLITLRYHPASCASTCHLRAGKYCIFAKTARGEKISPFA